jgi:hypothetical protein
MGACPYSGREVLWGLAPTRWPSSSASKKVRRANFVELRKAEVQLPRISLPRTTVNRP